MLGFGEGEGREKEKREERQSFFLRLCFFILRFLSGFRKGFSLLIYLFIFIYVCFNTVLMWKIVGVSKISVLYIYIYIDNSVICHIGISYISFINRQEKKYCSHCLG